MPHSYCPVADAAGKQYTDTYAKLLEKGVPHEEAWQQVAPWAVGTGIVNALTTGLGASSGLESLLRNPNALRQALQPVWKAVFKGAVAENAEELPTELISQIFAARAVDKKADIAKVIGDFIRNAPQLIASVSLLGGFGEGKKAWLENRGALVETADALGATRDLPSARDSANGSIAGDRQPTPAVVPVFSTTQPPGETTVSSTAATLHPVLDKQQLAVQGYPAQAVEQYIRTHYQSDKYQELGGKDTIWLVTPSSSGKNTIPQVLADKLAKDHGGTVLSSGLVMTQSTQAKTKKGYLAKMEAPTVVNIVNPELAGRLAGKKVVIVDDIMTS